MHLVILTAGPGGALSTLHLRHGLNPKIGAGPVNLLVLDSRHMSPDCFAAATQAVNDIRARHGLRHGVMLCGAKPPLPMVVAGIRCGLRDIISQYIGAAHLRQVLRASVPSLGRREFRDAIAFLRTFSGFSGAGAATEGDTHIGRRAEDLNRRAEALAERENAINLAKEQLAKAERELRERTRRLDRQLARMQTDADLGPPAHAAHSDSTPSIGSPDLAALARRLEQRAAELDVREKLLNEMQALLIATPQGAAFGKPSAVARATVGTHA